jgi:hypothetical protein
LRKINVRDFRRATRSTSREINRQIALNLVHEHQPISRADLARMMGIRRGMATGLVNELLDERLIYDAPAPVVLEASGARPECRGKMRAPARMQIHAIAA